MFSWKPDLGAMNLSILFSHLVSDEWFKVRFAGTPILRTGRAGLRRNVAVAIGNTNDKKLLPVLETGLSDESVIVIEHTQWAINRLQGD